MGSLAGAACGSIASSSSVSLARTIRLTLHANALRYTASSTLPPPRTRSRPSPCPRFISEFVPSIPARTPYRLRHSLPDSALRLRSMFTLIRSAFRTYTPPRARGASGRRRYVTGQRVRSAHGPQSMREKTSSTRSGASSLWCAATARCPAGHAADPIAAASMSKSAAVSITGPSPPTASFTFLPLTGLTISVPRRSASHTFRPEP